MPFKVIDQICDVLGRTVAWFTVLMAIVTVVVVVLRYAFDQGTILLQESVMYLHGFAFMLAIPYALKEEAHVRVDLLYARMSPRRKATVDLAGHVIFLLPVAATIFFTSLPYVSRAWRVLEGSGEVGGIPGIYILKTLIPAMAVLLFLQGLAECARAVRAILK